MSKRIDSLRIPLEIALVKLSYQKKDSPGGRPLNPAQNKEVDPPRNKEVDPPQAPVIKSAPQSEDAPAAESAPQQPKPAEINLVPFDEIKNSWQAIVEHISKTKMHVATYLGHGELLALDNNTLTIALSSAYYKESLESKENKNIIEKSIAQLLHADLKVKFTVSGQAGHKKEEGSSLLKSALEMFQGRVIKED